MLRSSMEKLFDAHAHLADEAFSDDRDNIINMMQKKKIWALNCGCDVRSSYLSTVLAKRVDFLFSAVGMHPHDAKDYTDETERQFTAWLAEEKTVAVGEIGLDYHYDFSPRDVQRDVFARQIHMANTHNLPLVIHSREAVKDTYDILKSEMNSPRGAVLHSFSQSKEMLYKYLDMNIYFSISGPVTYANADKLRETVKEIPENRLMIETDCPYLTPVPHRGKRNDPTYVECVALKIAEIKNMPYAEICERTFQNALDFFNIST